MAYPRPQLPMTKLDQFIEESLDKSKMPPVDKARMVFEEMRNDLNKLQVKRPWCLRDFARFVCFVEFDMRTPSQWVEFIHFEFPAESRTAQINFLAFCDQLLLYVHSWQYMKADEVRFVEKLIDSFRTKVVHQNLKR
jgi:hypothetical protein